MLRFEGKQCPQRDVTEVDVSRRGAVINEENESRLQHRPAVAVQDLLSDWVSMPPCEE